MMKKETKSFFKTALELARQAVLKNEVPIGAVIVANDRIIGRGYNRTRKNKDVFSHAEVIALKQAARRGGDSRLEKASLYVTLEPCLMCLGAALLARIKEIHYILPDPAFGSFRSLLKKKNQGSYKGMKFFEYQELQPEVKQLLKKFFDKLRKR